MAMEDWTRSQAVAKTADRTASQQIIYYLAIFV